MYASTSLRLPLYGPGFSILLDTSAVAQRSALSIGCFILSVMYPAKVVSPLPLLPERFLAFIGQVHSFSPSYAMTSVLCVITTSFAPHACYIFAATALSG